MRSNFALSLVLTTSLFGTGFAEQGTGLFAESILPELTPPSIISIEDTSSPQSTVNVEAKKEPIEQATQELIEKAKKETQDKVDNNPDLSIQTLSGSPKAPPLAKSDTALNFFTLSQDTVPTSVAIETTKYEKTETNTKDVTVISLNSSFPNKRLIKGLLIISDEETIPVEALKQESVIRSGTKIITLPTPEN